MSTRGTSPDGRYTCFYCAENDGKTTHARFTVHDSRGCLHVCFEHAQWRQTTSMTGGHSRDCPHREMEPLVAEAHKAMGQRWGVWVKPPPGSGGLGFMDRTFSTEGEALALALAQANDMGVHGYHYDVRPVPDPCDLCGWPVARTRPCAAHDGLEPMAERWGVRYCEPPGERWCWTPYRAATNEQAVAHARHLNSSPQSAVEALRVYEAAPLPTDPA